MMTDLDLLLGPGYASLAKSTHAVAESSIEPLDDVGDEPDDPSQEEELVREMLAILAREGVLGCAVPIAWAKRSGPEASALVANLNGSGPEGGEASTREPTGGNPEERLDVRAVCVVREALASHCGLADVAFVMQGLGSFPIALEGSEELKLLWLPRVARGEAVAAFALTEPNAGSDLGGIETTARPDGDGYVLDGLKTLISNAPIADLITVIARTSPGSGAKGLTAFAVPGDAMGLDNSERIRTIAPHPIGRLRFSGVRVPASARIGPEGEGGRVALATLGRFRATVGAAATGFARRALDEAIAHAERREQFGRPISGFQGIRMKLADMATQIDAARMLVYRAAARIDSGERAQKEASMAKLFATEAAASVADEAVQIHGGLGVVRGTLVERIYREVRALRIYEGTSEVQRTIIGRSLVEEGQ